jgi:hypothetical protein
VPRLHVPFIRTGRILLKMIPSMVITPLFFAITACLLVEAMDLLRLM